VTRSVKIDWSRGAYAGTPPPKSRSLVYGAGSWCSARIHTADPWALGATSPSRSVIVVALHRPLPDGHGALPPFQNSLLDRHPDTHQHLPIRQVLARANLVRMLRAEAGFGVGG